MTSTPSSPKLAEPSVESCIVALVGALQHSKGWLHDYADAVVRDAIDRRHLEGDAERFRWLLDNANIDFDPSELYQLVIWEPGTGQDWKAIVRAAIDAARAAQEVKP